MALGGVVGMPGFEPGASASQRRRANQTAPHPGGCVVGDRRGRGRLPGSERLAHVRCRTRVAASTRSDAVAVRAHDVALVQFASEAFFAGHVHELRNLPLLEASDVVEVHGFRGKRLPAVSARSALPFSHQASQARNSPLPSAADGAPVPVAVGIVGVPPTPGVTHARAAVRLGLRVLLVAPSKRRAWQVASADRTAPRLTWIRHRESMHRPCDISPRWTLPVPHATLAPPAVAALLRVPVAPRLGPSPPASHPPAPRAVAEADAGAVPERSEPP